MSNSLLQATNVVFAITCLVLYMRVRKRESTIESLNATIASHEVTIACLKELAMYDSLTGLYTRRFMNDRMASLQSDATRFAHKDVLALFIDVDHFKKVNDRHGHDVGDCVLKAVAEIVRDKLRTNDVAGRWGGEEIVVLGRGNGKVVAERIRRAIDETTVNGISVTVSIGVADYEPNPNPRIEESLLAVIGQADKAMYRAKADGRNRVHHIQDILPPAR